MRVGMIFAMELPRRVGPGGPARGESPRPARALRARAARLRALALALALGAALAHAAAAQGDGEASGDGAGDDADRITLHLAGMTYVASAGTANEMVIEADRATILPDAEIAKLRDMRARITPDAASGRSGGLDMTCEHGTFELASGDFVAEGDVRGVTGDGRRFRTRRLRYHHDQGLVVADVPVQIRDAAGTYRGGGFQYWVRENRFRLSGGATVVQDREQ